MRSELLGYLCCPVCGGSLSLRKASATKGEITYGELVCEVCGRLYPIRNGVPNFIVSECLKTINKVSKIFYNIYAPLYDTVERKLAMLSGFKEEDLRNEIVSRMEIKQGHNVLEIAIGTGGNIPYFRKYTDELIVGLDISERMLSTCLNKIKKYSWRNIELVLGCAEYLPFKSGMFDRLLVGGGITYFGDVGRALKEVSRVVKNNAKVVIYDQVTFIDRMREKDKVVLKYLPKDLKLINYTYLFDKRFYVIELVKKG
ncbi:MAG: hypothetical protein DRO18_04045 [Thermoprotei archaeon]|nr:MAG: hypothetical protein DRO18_04045 [Thermoprotei archaeon]